MRFLAFVATFSSFVGNRESNKTKEERVEGFSLRLFIPSRAWEPVLEVEANLADSVVQPVTVSSPWLVVLPMANCHIFPSKKVRAWAPRL